MVDESTVVLELAIMHHIEGRDYVKAKQIAKRLDEDPRPVGGALGRLRERGFAQSWGDSSNDHAWQPVRPREGAR